jgi:GNAT superfamily N-acetyltransferase
MMIIRAAKFPNDMPQLQELSPPSVKPALDFFMYPTLVAVEIHESTFAQYEPDREEILGYTQFAFGPDLVLHSKAIRIAKEAKGKGVGAALMTEKIRLARLAGARMHLYPVDTHGEVALKKILLKLGMHLCKDGDPIQIYAQHYED